MSPFARSPRPGRGRRSGRALRWIAFAIFLLAPGFASAQIDLGEVPTAHVPFELPFEATDVVFDRQRDMLYATSIADRRVYFVDLATGLTVRQFDFEWMPEHLSLTPDGSRLFVALLTRAHSSYWWDGEHEGYIASFDLDLRAKDRQFWIPEDPFGLAATRSGRLVVSSGSGQWTDIHVFDAVTGAQRGTAGSIRERSFVALHPREDAVYTSGGTSYPQDIHHWSLGPDGSITHRWDSIYHGDHRISGAAWVSPLGDVIISQGGAVFTAGFNSRDADIIYLRDLTPRSFTALDFDATRHVILTALGTTVSYYNLESFEWIDDVSVLNPVDFVGVVGLNVYTLASGSGSSRLEVTEHRVPDGDTNTSPSAAFSVEPATGWTTLTDLTFDASASSDAESGLVYRWDLQDDGEWDTEFSASPSLIHRFETAGTKFVRLQVKDDAGAVDSTVQILDVAFEADPGSPGEIHASFSLPFEIASAVFDPTRPYVYVSSSERQAVYFVNLETGFIEKSFSFSWRPENLAITPDASRLYVALPVQPHNHYWWDGDHEGYIASFDLDRQVKDRQFWIPEDPYGLAARDDGDLVVSSGSGQWTYVHVFDGETGKLLSSNSRPYERTRFAFHPNQTMLYAADTAVSPSDIYRYDVNDLGRISYRWDSIYHGDHRMYGNVWPSPLGDTLITRGGDVFTAAGVDRSSDMIYLRGLTPSYVDALAYDVFRNVIVTGRDGELGYYNLSSYESIGTTTVTGDISYVGVKGLHVYAVQVENGETHIRLFDHPVPNGDTETPPSIAYTISPDGDLTTLTDVTFDASGSSDAEGALLYRWDLDGDGVWDTEFSSNPILVYRFETAGTKFIRAQVKDTAGWVSETEFSVDIAFEPDPGEPGQPHPGFVFEFPVTDVAFDPLRPYAYVSSRERHQLHFVNTETGFIEKTFTFPWMPESLAITPDGSRLYVSLAVRDHSAYWFDGDHEGYIASFDLELQVKDRQFWIPEDPYDLLATSNGHLVVSSGSGQWTYARVFDGESGALLGSISGVRHGTRLSLYPDESIVYAADNGLSPSDIERYDLSEAGQITYRWDSIYHGDHRMSGNIWASPLGDVVITRGGDVFTAAGADRASDMIYIRGLTPSYVNAIAYDASRKVIFTGRDGDIGYYNIGSFEKIGSTSVGGDVRFLGARDLHVYAVLWGPSQARLVQLPHPLPHGDTDVPPVAALTVRPESDWTTLTDITLDASSSTDAEGPLVYRWDLNNDGAWDTEFSASAVLVHRFSTAGTKFIRLQVKDTAANVDEVELTLDVAFEPDPGAPGPVHPSFVIPFEATQAVFDPFRPYVYVTSLARHALYIVNLETGFIERTFDFDEMPERMAITPDGSKLYVALLTQNHSSYWWNEEQEGYIARFDLDLQVKDRQFRIEIDPYDLVATSDGELVVTSGSGQWTNIGLFDGDTGALRNLARYSIRERSTLDLHPSEKMVYSAGGTSYPQDVHRWNLDETEGLQHAWDSIYHGHHRVGNDVWASPRGDVLITAGGDVFSANGQSRDTDILYLRSLDPTAIRDLVWSSRSNDFALIDDTSVQIFDMQSYARLHRFALDGIGRFVGRRGPLVYAMTVNGGETKLAVLVHGNRAPVAGIAAIRAAECEGPDGAYVRLDGSMSSDEDSITGVFEDIVSYEWLLEDVDSGDWISLGQGELLDVKLPLGSHRVQLRIADHAGETSTATASADVADTVAPELSVTADPGMLAELNRQMVEVQIGVMARDTCGSVGITLADATSNAESIPAPRLPSFLADIQDAEIGTDDRSVQLRAEHNPTGPQRIYTLTYSAIDESGNETVAAVEIPVIEPTSLRDRRR